MFDWFKKEKQKITCPCGKLFGCKGKFGYLYLYDIVGNGSVKINWSRASQCKVFIKDVNRQIIAGQRLVEHDKGSLR